MPEGGGEQLDLVALPSVLAGREGFCGPPGIFLALHSIPSVIPLGPWGRGGVCDVCWKAEQVHKHVRRGDLCRGIQ